METAHLLAEHLLRIKAIQLKPNEPFTWASGWKSPIYCDNRKTLSHHDVRNFIKDAFVDLIKSQFPDVQVIAGVATGAIAQGALVANEMELPFVYVRSEAKDHGTKRLVEGEISAGQKVVVVEDLISTGKSSLQVVNELRKENCEVLGMVAIFSYQFPKAESAFAEVGCKLVTLGNYESLLQHAIQTGYITTEQQKLLATWKNSPDTWTGK